jgi:hypothetical protein
MNSNGIIYFRRLLAAKRQASATTTLTTAAAAAATTTATTPHPRLSPFKLSAVEKTLFCRIKKIIYEFLTF